MGIKHNLQFLAVLQAAGFHLTGAKVIDTDDGYAFSATLVHGTRKIVTVSNGGYGGPDQFAYHADGKTSQADIDTSLQQLYAVPAVIAFGRAHLLHFEKLMLDVGRCTKEQFEAAKARIESELPKFTEEMLGVLVDDLRSHKETATKLKRSLRGKLAWITKGEEDGNTYTKLNCEDTPSNRATAQKRYGSEIDVFVNDLLVGL